MIVLTINVPEEIGEDDFLDLNIIVLRNIHRKGFGANHNTAAALANGELFIIINPDIRLPERDVLERIVAMEWGQPRPALRAPVVVTPAGLVEDSVRRNLSLPNLLRRFRRPSKGWEVEPSEKNFFWLAGMFLIAPLDIFRAWAGFDEGYHLYCEDYDLSARWRINGGLVEVISDLKVVHDAQRDSHKSLRHMKWHIASLMRVWRSTSFWRVVLGRKYHL